MALRGSGSLRAFCCHCDGSCHSSGDAGGVADRPVLVAQVGPGRLDRARVPVPVEALQLPAQVPLRPGLGVGGLARRADLAAGVGHAVEGRLRSAAADGEIHRAVLRVDDHVGHRQRLAAEELLHLGGVAGPLGPEVDGAELAEAPVADEQGVLILLGELRPVAERDPRRRARADVRRPPRSCRCSRPATCPSRCGSRTRRR